MTRMHLPADHNHAIAHHKRTALEAFPCDAQQAVAMHCASRGGGLLLALWAWLTVIALCVAAALAQLLP